MRGFISASIMSAVVVVAVACGGGRKEPPAEPHALGGTVALASTCPAACSDAANPSPDASWRDGEHCAGSGEYADMKAGTPVVVKDTRGVVIANGQLQPGVGSGTAYLEPDHRPYAATCVFAFAIDSVPDSDYYIVEVLRGASTYSKSDLESKNWTVAMTAGGS